MVARFRTFALAITLQFSPPGFNAMAQFHYSFAVQPLDIKDFPAIHSFAYGKWKQNLILIGGRHDGLHPKEGGFERKGSNERVYVWDTRSHQIRTFSLSHLPILFRNALCTANAAFTQWGNHLIVAGGYGESVEGEFKTFPYLSMIDLAYFYDLLTSGQDPTAAIRVIENDTFALAGAELRELRDTFYLVGGHNFIGKYSSSSSKITQRYSNSVRIFTLDTSKSAAAFSILQEMVDEFNFHRRDFNLKKIVDPSFNEKLIVFSGVFQYNVDRPFHNIALLDFSGYTDIENFAHRLASYRCGTIGFFSRKSRSMTNVFFGGMAEFYPNDNGTLVEDSKVPFVKTISGVTSDSSGQFLEWFDGRGLPGYIGTNSEFYINPTLPMINDETISLDELPQINDTLWLGYLFGGIENPLSEINPWDKDLANMTRAMEKVYKIYLTPKIVRTKNVTNKFDKHAKICARIISPGRLLLETSSSDGSLEVDSYWIIGPDGKAIGHKRWDVAQTLPMTIQLDATKSGTYIIYVQNKDKSIVTAKWIAD